MKRVAEAEREYLRMKKLRMKHKDLYLRVLEMLGTKDIDQKVGIGNRVVHHMLNNPDFDKPVPSVEFLQFVTEELDMAWYEKRYGLARNKNSLTVMEGFFDSVFATIVVYVASVAKGSERIYRSAGLAPVLDVLQYK